ncbi:hypothetical protein LSH36_196g01036 [Paralvinella palmiformis]|uniref:G-protein coupled receptors family 1 profile domain-containing protein n=1 Tax=Paralvinella palmiformis TaxID=53620 RepID=A0AAD9N6D6_9ANNE|nr:hypothetical protein LSH36_196g01036 [Paralvinella palmiformis]
MSFPLHDDLPDMNYVEQWDFLFNASDGAFYLGFNETMDILDFISGEGSPPRRNVARGYDTEPGATYLDQQELNDVLKEFRNNLFSYTDPKTILLICLYVPIFISALVGNISVLMVILLNRHMRNITNCFIVNLAIADMLGKLVALFLVPLSIDRCRWNHGRE